MLEQIELSSNPGSSTSLKDYDGETFDSTEIQPKTIQDRNCRQVPRLIVLFIFIYSLVESIQAIPLLQAWRFFLCRDFTKRYEMHSNSREANAFANEALCQTSKISTQVAMVNGYFKAFGISLAILSIILWGRYSDAKGRRLAFRVCYLGVVIAHVLTVLAFWFWQTTGVAGLYLTAIVSGLFGGPSFLVATYHAMLTDILDQNDRLIWFARTVGVWYSGRVVGPAIGSFLLNQQLLLPIYAVTVLASLNLIPVYCLPETLVSNLQTPASVIRWDFHRIVRGAVDTLLLCFYNKRMVLITFTSLVYYFSFSIVAILVQYVNTKYHWSMEMTGYLASVHAAAKFLVAMTFLPIWKTYIFNKWRTTDTRTNVIIVIFSFVVDCASWLFVAILPFSFLIPSLGLGTLGIGLSASLKALAATEIPSQDHGKLFACLGVVDALGILVASPALAAIYSATLTSYPEMAFIFVAFLFGLCAVIFWRYEKFDGSARPGRAEDHILYQSVHTGLESTDIALVN